MKKLTLTTLTLLALTLVVGSARADQLSVFRNTLTDVVSRSKSFSTKARIDLKRGGPNQNTVIGGAADLSRGAQTLSNHLNAKQVDQFDGDLENISNARNAIDEAMGGAAPTARLRNEWQLLRDATDAMLQIASGNQGGGTAQVDQGDEAPPVRVAGPNVGVAGPIGGPARVSVVNLVGPDEMHFAAADLAAMIDNLAGQVRRYGPLDGRRRAALDALGAMRVHCDTLAGAASMEDVRPAAQALTQLINSVDRTLPNLGDYGTRRPLWQQARVLALGIVKHSR